MVGVEKYLLDTNVIIEVLRGNDDMITKIESVGQSNCYISEITLAELLYGAVRSNNPKNFHDVECIEQEFHVLSIRPAYRQYAETRNLLRQKGTPIDHMDLFVASVAMYNNLTLVSHNTKHFVRINILKYCCPVKTGFGSFVLKQIH